MKNFMSLFALGVLVGAAAFLAVLIVTMLGTFLIFGVEHTIVSAHENYLTIALCAALIILGAGIWTPFVGYLDRYWRQRDLEWLDT